MAIAHFWTAALRQIAVMKQLSMWWLADTRRTCLGLKANAEGGSSARSWSIDEVRFLDEVRTR